MSGDGRGWGGVGRRGRRRRGASGTKVGSCTPRSRRPSQLAALRGFIGHCGGECRRPAGAAECPGNGANVDVSVNKAGALGRRRLRCNRVASLPDLADFIRHRQSIVREDHLAPVFCCRQEAARSLPMPSFTTHPPLVFRRSL